MGKYKHEGKGRNISIGGGKQRSDLFKDMSGGYNAMGDSNKPSPVYNYGGNSVAKRYSPMKKALVGDQNQLPDHLVKAIKAAPEMKGSPMYKTGCTSGSSSNAPYKMMGDPNKKMDRLSAKHKSLYDRFEMGQTSEKEEQRMFRLEDRMDKVGKKIKKSKKSPLNQGTRSSKRQSRPDVSTLGEKEFLNSNSFGYPTNRTQLQESAKERTSDPDYKKPKAKTLKKSPLNQGKKEMSKAEFKKAFEKKSKNPGDDPKLKKRLSTTQDESKKKKTTKSPLNQGKKKVKTLGEKETRQDRRAGRDNIRQGYFGIGGDDPKKTKLQRDAKERTSDPDYKKPKAKTLKKSPLNQGFDADSVFKTLPGGKNYPKPPFKPGVKADEDRTKKDKRKHKRTMKKLGRLTKKIVLKSTSKK